MKFFFTVFLLAYFFCISEIAHGQTQDTLIRDTLAYFDPIAVTDTAFSGLNYWKIPSHILIDRVFPFVSPELFTGHPASDSVLTTNTFLSLYGRLYESIIGTKNLNYSFDTIFKYTTAYKAKNEVPIGIIRMKYGKVKDSALANNLISYDSVTVRFTDLTDSAHSPYDEKLAFAAGPLYQTQFGLTAKFIIDTTYLKIANDLPAIDSILIDFGNSAGYQKVFSDSVNVVTYSSTGQKIIKTKIFYASDTLESYATYNILSDNSFLPDTTMHVLAQSITTSGVTSVPGAQISIFFGCGNEASRTLRKPLILVQPFWQDQQIDASTVYFSFDKQIQVSANNTDFLCCFLQKQGYDIVVVTFDNGWDLIQNNASALVKVIDFVNTHKTTNIENIIVGESMGGMIARYALDLMEDPSLNLPKHNCRLYWSFDAPQRGAYAPVGMQFLTRYIERIIPRALLYIANHLFTARIDISQLDNLIAALDAPAAAQMLIAYVSLSPDLDGLDLQSIRDDYRNDLINRGYPQLTRNIALTQGSLNGTTQGYPKSSQILSWHLAHFWYSADIDVWGLPDQNDGTKTIAHLHSRQGFWEVDGETAYANGTRPFEIVPGSWQRVTGIAVDQINNMSKDKASTEGHDVQCFVPTYSALDISESHMFDNINSLNITTPFNKFFGTTTNFDHISGPDVWIDGSPFNTFNSDFNDQLMSIVNNEIMPIDLFLQNRTISNTNVDFEAINTISCGNHVTTNLPSGDFIISGNSSVNMRAGVAINVEDGTRISTSSNAHLFISPFPTCTDCQSAVSSPKRTEQKPQTTASIASAITIQLNPNPSSSFIEMHIKSDENLSDYKIQIFDILGNEMHIPNLNGSGANQTEITEKINVVSLASGSYIMKVTFQTGQVVNKLFTVVK